MFTKAALLALLPAIAAAGNVFATDSWDGNVTAADVSDTCKSAWNANAQNCQNLSDFTGIVENTPNQQKLDNLCTSSCQQGLEQYMSTLQSACTSNDYPKLNQWARSLPSDVTDNIKEVLSALSKGKIQLYAKDE